MNAQRRIFLLISLVAAAGIALLVFALLRNQKTPQIVLPTPISDEQVLVAKADIPAGAPVHVSMVHWQDWPSNHMLPGAISGGADSDVKQHISSTVARARILKGMPITDAMLIKTHAAGYMAAMLAPGMRAMSLPVSVDRAVAGFIRPGNHVDILYAHTQNGHPQIKEVLRDVRVLALDQTAEEKNENQQAVKSLHNVTLELTPDQTKALTKAHLTGNLSLTLRPLPQDGDSSGLIRIIRGGPAPDSDKQ